MKRILLGLAILSLVAGCGGGKKKIALASQQRQLGETKLQEGNAEGALADLAQAHKLDPKNAEIAHSLGMAYWAKARLVGDDSLKLEAEKYVLLSFKLKGKDVPGDWHNNLGALYVDMKRYGDAVKELEIAVRDPEYRTPERPNNNLAEAFLQQGDCRKAADYADKALRIQPRFCMARINKAKADECLKNDADALDNYARAISECPEYPEPHLRFGMLKYKTGTADGKRTARDEWTKVKTMDPDGPYGKQANQYLLTLGK